MKTWMLPLVLALLWDGVTALQCDYAAGAPELHRDRYLQGATHCMHVFEKTVLGACLNAGKECAASRAAGRPFQVPALSSLNGLGLSMCERKCRNTTGSLAFNYLRPDGKCECLGENSTSSAQAVVSREGWYHGHVTSAGQVAGTNCTCADGNACVLDLPAVIRCPTACPPPPPLENATVQVTSLSPGAAASYACVEDFKFFGSSSHVTCSVEGTWEALNGTCEQVSWTGNPASHSYVVPQPVTAQWRLVVIFNLTTTIRTFVDLMDGSTTRLTVSIRVDYLGTQRYTVLNSAVGGWQTPVNIYNAPWYTGMAYNVTVVVNCPAVGYQVWLNKTLHGVYNTSKPCYPVRTIDLGEMKLYELHMVYP